MAQPTVSAPYNKGQSLSNVGPGWHVFPHTISTGNLELTPNPARRIQVRQDGTLKIRTAAGIDETFTVVNGDIIEGVITRIYGTTDGVSTAILLWITV